MLLGLIILVQPQGVQRVSLLVDKCLSPKDGTIKSLRTNVVKSHVQRTDGLISSAFKRAVFKCFVLTPLTLTC